MTEQYLSRQQLSELVAVTDFSNLKPISTDSYSDSEIYKTIEAKRGMKILLYCALQTAIVGSGNKVFGEFEMNSEKIEVKSVYKEYGVKDDLESKIEPGDLTPRRLQRFFRIQIKNYLDQNENIYPYLWKKYSTLDKRYRSTTFPGAESLIENKDAAMYLLDTYKKLDSMLSLNISDRIKRVLIARNIINISEIDEGISEKVDDVFKQSIFTGDKIIKKITNQELPENEEISNELKEILQEDGSWDEIKNDKEFLNFLKEAETFFQNKE